MELKVGVIDDFFKRVGVMALKIEDELAVGDTIHVKGHTTDFTQKVESMQIDRQTVAKAKKGDSVGIKTPEFVRKGDVVYKVV